MTPLETALHPHSLTEGEKLVISKMIPEQEIRAAALQPKVGTSPRVTPILSRLADAGYVRVDRQVGRSYLWVLNRERAIGRKGRAKRTKRDPLKQMRNDIEVMRVALTRMEQALGVLAHQLEALETIKGALNP